MKKFSMMLLLSLFTLFMSSCGSKEGEIVDHLEAIDKLMRNHMDEPAEGVEKWLSYMEKHSNELDKLKADLIIELAGIDGDGDREERADEIKEALEKTVKNYNGTHEKFFTKVRSDKEAQKKFNEWIEYRQKANRLMPDLPF